MGYSKLCNNFFSSSILQKAGRRGWGAAVAGANKEVTDFTSPNSRFPKSRFCPTWSLLLQCILCLVKFILEYPHEHPHLMSISSPMAQNNSFWPTDPTGASTGHIQILMVMHVPTSNGLQFKQPSASAVTDFTPVYFLPILKSISDVASVPRDLSVSHTSPLLIKLHVLWKSSWIFTVHFNIQSQEDHDTQATLLQQDL